MGTLFFMLTCRLVNLRIVIRLKNKTSSQILTAISSAINIWKGYGSSPAVIAWDQEPSIIACAPEVWSKHSIRFDFTPPGGHEKVAERNVRTIKEHVFASILGLGHAIDDHSLLFFLLFLILLRYPPPLQLLLLLLFLLLLLLRSLNLVAHNVPVLLNHLVTTDS